MTSSFLPDINIWIALHFEGHRHHAEAVEWFRRLHGSDPLVFCRHTQIGLFRLLTTEAVMREAVLTQRQCWALYARWIEGERAVMRADPEGLDEAFRKITLGNTPSPKVWADAYLAAFAETAGLTLVTLDKALAEKARGAVLLGGGQ